MVEHVVLFRIREGTPAEAVDAAGAAIRALSARLPGIRSITFGANFTDRGRGYTHMLIVRFDDRAALERYLPHPEHERVVKERFRPIVEEVLAVDIEA